MGDASSSSGLLFATGDAFANQRLSRELYRVATEPSFIERMFGPCSGDRDIIRWRGGRSIAQLRRATQDRVNLQWKIRKRMKWLVEKNGPPVGLDSRFLDGRTIGQMALRVDRRRALERELRRVMNALEKMNEERKNVALDTEDPRPERAGMPLRQFKGMLQFGTKMRVAGGKIETEGG